MAGWLIVRSAESPTYTAIEAGTQGMTYPAAQREVKRINGLIATASAIVKDSEDRPGAYIHVRGVDELRAILEK